MMMLMTLSHCVVVKASLVCGVLATSAAGFSTTAAGVSTSAAGVSASTAGGSAAAFTFLSCSFAMMTSASANFFSAPREPAAFSQRFSCRLQHVLDF